MFRRFYRRRFLNRRGHHAGAYVIAECSLERWKTEIHLQADLTIADCSRVVTLDFSHEAGDGAAARNALHKAHALQAVLADFVVALEAAQQEMDRARPRGAG